MDSEIKKRCEYLLELIDEYADCDSCGHVIKDISLLVPDTLNPGRYRSYCPTCTKETTKTVFPPKNIRHLYKLIVETAEMNKPILVLVLARTIFEVLIDGILYRLMECRYTNSEIVESIMLRCDYQRKLKIIEDITNLKLKEHAKKADHKRLTATLQELTELRNAFLHDGIASKYEKVDEQIGYPIIKPVPLGKKEMLKAINFSIDIIDFF